MEPDNGKQYSLRWEKHAFNLASEAGCFFEDESFLDCTLSAEGQCIEAHKIILSAASSYLSNLLKIMPDKHPILIFNDIKFEQLKSLVAFIYNGSVNVSENNIHAFLNAAQSLLIKGLSEESKEEEKAVENIKKTPKNIEIQDTKTNCKKNTPKLLLPKKHDFPLDLGRSFKKQRQILPKADGSPYIECEESLSKLQEISITKYIHQNLNSKPPIKGEILENKWNGPIDEKRAPENYVVKSWKHNSVEDLNGRLKQSRNNAIKKVSLEKPTVFGSEDFEPGDKKKVPLEHTDLAAGWYLKKIKLKMTINENSPVIQHFVIPMLLSAPAPLAKNLFFLKRTKTWVQYDPQECKIRKEGYITQALKPESVVLKLGSEKGNYIDQTRPEEAEDKIKKEIETEKIMIVEPKQEIIEEEDTNSEEYNLHTSNNDPITSDSDSLYENRSMSNYHNQPVVDRGIPVPLLMCRTSLSEPDSVEPNWIPPVAGNFRTDHSPSINSVDNNVQDLQCRTCAQDLPCPTCAKKYKSRYALNRHILYECGKARKSFSCDECGKKVTRQDTLQKHKLIHLVQHLKKKESEGEEESFKPKKICQ